MFRWTIDKEMHFEFGHRVYTQELNQEFSLCSKLQCRQLHGHSGLLKVFLAANELNNYMVTDFKHLKIFEKFIDDTIDHRFVMGINDPLRFNILPEIFDNKNDKTLIYHADYDYYTPNMEYFKPKFNDKDPKELAILEKLEGMVFVDFCPTSERLCQWWLEIADKMLAPLGVDVVRVEYWETKKSHCAYINPKFLKQS